ncbi:hypothetical protein N431DRAFT_551031 [Stipitochalara longipes BDJ]|nr:hypothetical protein N431DRAFT_551031 [Stipitochalara longipes BDJ]
MEDYMFKATVDRCRHVTEVTTCLKMFHYSDPNFNRVEEHPLEPEDFDSFLYRKGPFAEAILPDGVVFLQKKAKHPDTIAPQVISLKPEAYREMVKAFSLPQRAIETTSYVGPIFWSALDQDEQNPHLHIVQRKSDLRKKGMTRGWELILSHELQSGITSGFCKGTPSSDIADCIEHLKACVLEIGHPLLLPLIIYSHDSSHKVDIKQRDARGWLGVMEHALTMGFDIEEREGYMREDVVDLDAMNRDLVECQTQVLWKRPLAYLGLIESFKEAMKTPEMTSLQGRMSSRLGLYKTKWQAIDVYANTTLQRLDIQRSTLYNVIAQKESKLNFAMAGDQRKLAHLSKRDSSTMKTISLLGSVFLPGAYLASIFSTTFFNFQNAPNISSAVSPEFWLYWAITIPLTLIVVGLWLLWEKKKQRAHEREDLDIEKTSEKMERAIMATMRKRTRAISAAWVIRD